MKILLVNKFHYRRGGSETYYFALGDALIRYGHDVVYFALDHEKNIPCTQSKYFVKNIDYQSKMSKYQELKLAIKSIYSFEAKHKFERLIKKEKPEIVHINLVHRQITLSIVDVCKKYHIPVVFTAHDLVGPCLVGSLLTPQRLVCRECYDGCFINCVKHHCIKNSTSKSLVGYFEAIINKQNHSYNKISVFIAPSQFIKSELKESNITNSPIYQITNFLPAETKYEMTTYGKEKYFLFLGSLSKDKGVFTLVRAFHKAQLPCKLILAGTGEEETKIKSYIEKHGLQYKILLPGYVVGNTLTNLVEHAYVVVLPSECFENCPYALMEPMAKGKPVIGANIGGIPEMVIENKTGWKFESGDVHDLAGVLEKAFNIDTNEYQRLSKETCYFAKEKFSMDKYIEKITDIYINLIYPS